MPDNFTALLDDLARAAAQSSTLAPAARVRRRGEVRTRNGRIMASVLGVVAVGAVAAGSAIGLQHSGNHPTPATSGNAVPSATPTTQPSPAPSATQSANAVTPPSTAPSSPPPPKLFATITGLPQDPTLAVGGGWLQFTATITNGTSNTAAQIAPVLSLGHCACSNPDFGDAPLGQMQSLDPATGTWHDIPFDREGTGMDYIGAVQVPATDLTPGQTRSVTYRVRINAQQPYPIHNGAGSIDVSIVTHPGQSAQLVGDMATAQVQYTAG
jgi:hypothetical protein